MQLLFCVVILTIYVDFSELYFVVNICFKLFKKQIKYSEIFHAGIVVICYSAVFIFSIIITMFWKFHMKLILTNSTTIESLDIDHKKDNEKFNIGYRQNWEQVFGIDPLFWFVPFPVKRGRPEGDGLTWKTNENNSIQNNLTDYNTNFNSNEPPSIK